MNTRMRAPMGLAPAVLLAAALCAPLPAVSADARSMFADHVSALDYPEVAAPATLPLRWDFSGDREHAFHLETNAQQDMHGTHGEESTDVSQRTGMLGTVLVSSEPATRTASVVLKDASLTASTGSGAQAQEQTVALPTVAVAQMHEDGAIGPLDPAAPSAPFRALVTSLFEMPPEALAVGSAVQRQMVFPVTINNVPGVVEGPSTTTLTRYVQVGDCACAQLDTEFELDRVTLIGPVGVDYTVTVAGTSRSLFDVHGGRVVEGITVSVSSFHISAQMPGEGGALMPVELDMRIDQFSHLTLP